MANPTPRAPAKTAPKASDAGQTAAEVVAAPGPTPVALAPQTALDLPADLAAELAAEAKDAAATERPSVGKISLAGGAMTYMDQALPGNKVDVVILAAGFWNKFYHKKYNPRVIVNPTCFAVTDDPEADMEPHENVENPQHQNCSACPKFQWGSAGTPDEPSRGKACKETRRLVVVPVAALESKETFLKSEMAVIDVPVTSVRNYANFLNTLSASVKRPMYTVVTTLERVVDAKTQFKLTFSPISLINDVEIIQAIRSRMEEAKRVATTPYDEAFLQGESKEPGNGTGPEVNTKKFAG